MHWRKKKSKTGRKVYTQGAETVEVDEFKDLRSTIQSNRQCAKEVTMHGGAGEDEQQGRRRKSSSEREALQYSRESEDDGTDEQETGLELCTFSPHVTALLMNFNMPLHAWVSEN